MLRFLSFLVSLLPLVILQGSELARWSADRPPQGMALVKAPDASWTITHAAGVPVAAITPVADYYRRAAILIRVDKPVTDAVWLDVVYLDRGYGLISVTCGSRGVSDRDQRGVARLNTGTFRHAAFRLDRPVFDHRIKPGADILINGLPFLRSVAISDTEPPHESTPRVKPAVKLAHSMDLVISSGADSNTIEGLPDSLATMRNLFPLAKALGFNGIESYVKWNFVERAPGVFDWSFYDALVEEMEKNDLRWFPLLIAGSAYALPEWFFKSPDMTGYRCLEHNIEVEIPTIFNDNQVKYVRRFLAEFGKHYASRKVLLGVRLGPSANYGEAQYPASGAWGYKGRGLHTHFGYWAGDAYASPVFRKWLRERYASAGELNNAWGAAYSSFDDIKTFLPTTALTPRMRLDFVNWYMGAMSAWCGKWAAWAREAMPATSIYQSSGGWGAPAIGTDYTAQAKAMAALNGGIRLTNENDSYLNNVGATHLAASAAHFYGAKLGSEPAGFSSVRGVIGRLYNSLTNGADHLFYYHDNIYSNDRAADEWVKQAPLLDERAKPAAEIAVFYPDTDARVNDEVITYLRASAFFNRIQPLRSVTDYDFVSEQMVIDGALDRYKVLVFVYASMTEKPVLDRIARWIEAGGVAIYPERQHQRAGGFATVEGDRTVWKQWQQGQTGKGRLIFYRGHPEPVYYYMDFLRQELPNIDCLSATTRAALRMTKPQEVYWSLLSNGKLALLNYDDNDATVRLAGGKVIRMSPYTIALEEAK